jgi:hypothetical protein
MYDHQAYSHLPTLTNEMSFQSNEIKMPMQPCKKFIYSLVSLHMLGPKPIHL